jgi:hypothetical protein
MEIGAEVGMEIGGRGGRDENGVATFATYSGALTSWCTFYVVRSLRCEGEWDRAVYGDGVLLVFE